MGQLVSIIYEYANEEVLRNIAIGTEESASKFNVPVINVPEMAINVFHTLIDSDKVNEFESALKLAPYKLTFIGTFKQSGEPFIWTEQTEKSRNHSISRYKSMLRDVIEYDEEGVEISRRRPSEAEALNTQVNKIAGYNDRQL